MPRIRTLKPEHRQHRKVGQLDHITYRLWVGMILEADDEGRLVYDPEALRVLIFGYHVKVTRALVETSTMRLASLGLVNLYASEGQDYACFPSWHDHQKIDRPRPSLLPSCEASTSVRRAIDDKSRGLVSDLDLEGKGSDRKGRDRSVVEGSTTRSARSKPASPPTVDSLVTELGALEAYAHLDVRGAILRCEQFYLGKGKALTKGRVVNWLNGDAKDAVTRRPGQGSARARINDMWKDVKPGEIKL